MDSRNDFRGIYPDTDCPLQGCEDKDTLSNMLSCKVLLTHHKSSEISVKDIRYEDVFSQDSYKQKQATELFRQLLQTRNELLSQPVANTGPMHSRNTLQSMSYDNTYGN